MITLHQIRMSQWMLILLAKCYKLAKRLITFMQSVILSGELYMQAAVSNYYGKRQSAFVNFRNILKKTF